jgi:hypothetical protein
MNEAPAYTLSLRACTKGPLGRNEYEGITSR